MRSSNRRACAFVGALLFALALDAGANAQTAAQGFAVERLYPSAPGAGWFVMDTLAMHGALGGAADLTIGYAHAPLRIATSDGAQHLTVIDDQAFANLGFAGTYDRFRIYVNFNVPLVIGGQSGTVGPYAFTAPGVDPGSHPDTMSDPRVGFDARIVGAATSPLRVGVGVQLYVPNGDRGDYDTDGSYRAMGRVLVAGDLGRFTYAGHVGVHVRPLDDSPTPGSPRGSELLFGAAAGAKLMTAGDRAAFVVGPELFGASALASPFGSTSTAFEGLLSGRFEQTGENGAQLRLRLGAGTGLDSHFGAPEWRVVLGVEIFDHHQR